MLKEILTDPLLIIGASAAAATHWVTTYVNPYIGLLGGIGGLVVLGLTIIHKYNEIRKDNLDIRERERHEREHEREDQNKHI